MKLLSLSLGIKQPYTGREEVFAVNNLYLLNKLSEGKYHVSLVYHCDPKIKQIARQQLVLSEWISPIAHPFIAECTVFTYIQNHTQFRLLLLHSYGCHLQCQLFFQREFTIIFLFF